MTALYPLNRVPAWGWESTNVQAQHVHESVGSALVNEAEKIALMSPVPLNIAWSEHKKNSAKIHRCLANATKVAGYFPAIATIPSILQLAAVIKDPKKYSKGFYLRSLAQLLGAGLFLAVIDLAVTYDWHQKCKKIN